MSDLGGFEVINISKIRDGFFVGDCNCSSNLEVILTYKISHIINSSPSQVMNSFESLGIKYLSINWTENINQVININFKNLFDVKDEIANKIVNFIDEASNKGEGLLITSQRGKNRSCVTVLLYLMKKYRWSLEKCMEYLKSKKNDVEIMKQFMTQLSLFEARLNRNGSKTIDWNGSVHLILEQMDNNSEENLMKNTYLNGLQNKGYNLSNYTKIGLNFSIYILKLDTKKLKWIDNNSNKKDVLCYTNFSKDLFFQKEVNQVTIHKNLRPLKSIIKGNKSDFSLPGQIPKINKVSNDDSDISRRSVQINALGSKERVQSADQKNNNNVQIITKKVNNYITNNINNIIISPNFKTFQEFLEESKNNPNSKQVNQSNSNPTISPIASNNKGLYSQKPRDFDFNNDISNYSINKGNNLIGTGNNLLNSDKKQNNLIKNEQSKLSALDVGNSKNYQSNNQINNYKPSIPTSTNNKNSANYFKNYQPDSRKTNFGPNITTNLVVRPSTSKQGPVKIQDVNNKDNYKNILAINLSKMNPIQNNLNMITTNNNFNSQSMMRSNSLKANNNTNSRPSTAPSKNDINSNVIGMSKNPISGSNSQKRLPSPNIKSNNYLTSSNYNGKGGLNNSSKYRNQSPNVINSQSKMAYTGSFKGLSSKMFK